MISKTRLALSALAFSAAGFVGLLGYEGYTGQATIPVKGDVPTIGFGTTEGVKLGDTITPEASAIHKCVDVPLSQGEYDAFTSFAYNVGTSAFCSSTLVKKLNAGDYEGACQELKRWVYVKGRKVQGLVNRREKEFQMCMSR